MNFLHQFHWDLISFISRKRDAKMGLAPHGPIQTVLRSNLDTKHADHGKFLQAKQPTATETLVELKDNSIISVRP